MILYVNDTTDFNISLKLNIELELEYIEIVVCIHNKKAHTIQTKQFPAQDFSKALAFYRQQEHLLIGSKTI